MKQKKIKSFITAIAITLSLTLAGCAASANDSAANTEPAETMDETSGVETTDETAGEATNEAIGETTGTTATADFEFPEDIPAMKIGAVGSFTGSELNTQWRENLLSLSDAFNVEFQFVEANTLEDSAGAIENLCTAGVNGIIMQNLTESALDIAQKYDVPIVSYCQTYTDEQLGVFAGYSNFVGVITEDDKTAAAHAAEAMYDAGCRKVAIAGVTRGYAQLSDDRADYFKAKFEELGGEVIAEDYTMLDFASSISSFAAAYPDMDGIYSVILDESVFQTVSTEGLLGQVKIAGFDMSDSCDTFFESGDLVFTCTGQQATIVTAFAPLYNYMCDGTYLIPERSKMVSRNYVEIHNAEECQDYNEYVRFSTCYSPEEIGYMIVGFNSDYTFEQYEEVHLSFSIEDVKERTLGK